jgi:hypothetical protein
LWRIADNPSPPLRIPSVLLENGGLERRGVYIGAIKKTKIRRVGFFIKKGDFGDFGEYYLLAQTFESEAKGGKK